MTMPTGIGAVDLMISFPKADAAKTYEYLREPRTQRTRALRSSPPGTCSRTCPTNSRKGDDGVAITIGEMDTWGVAVGMVGIGSDTTARALKEHPDRFVAQHRDRPERHHRRGPQDPRRARRSTTSRPSPRSRPGATRRFR